MKKTMLTIGFMITLWSVMAIVSGIITSGGISQFTGQYMETIGMIKPLHTMVDYYTHIKGIEYLICVTFFIAFPVFFKYINKEKSSKKITV